MSAVCCSFSYYSLHFLRWYYSAVGFCIVTVLDRWMDAWIDGCNWLPHRMFTWIGNGLVPEVKIELVCFAKGLLVELFATVHTALQTNPLPPPPQKDKCNVHLSLNDYGMLWKWHYIKLHLLPGPHPLYPSVPLSCLLKLGCLLWEKIRKLPVLGIAGVFQRFRVKKSSKYFGSPTKVRKGECT